MSDALPFTGERFVPECAGEIAYEHWHRYALASQLCPRATVLDVACGEGYGAALLAEQAERVVGVDVSSAVVDHASKRYGQQANLEFVCAPCDQLPFADASFDLAISFETIEHIAQQQAFVAELARVLRPAGVLLLSSPNKHLYADLPDYHNEFHVRELYRDELEELLRPCFPHRAWLGQRLLFHSTIWPEDQEPGTTEYLLGEGRQIARQVRPMAEPMYHLVACSRDRSLLPAALRRLSLFSDVADSVHRDYAQLSRRLLALDSLLLDRERMIAERDELLQLRNGNIEQREQLIAERDALLAQRTLQMQERERLIVERDGQLKMRAAQIVERDKQLAQAADKIAGLTQELVHRESFSWLLKSPWRLIKRLLTARH